MPFPFSEYEVMEGRSDKSTGISCTEYRSRISTVERSENVTGVRRSIAWPGVTVMGESWYTVSLLCTVLSCAYAEENRKDVRRKSIRVRGLVTEKSFMMLCP